VRSRGRLIVLEESAAREVGRISRRVRSPRAVGAAGVIVGGACSGAGDREVQRDKPERKRDEERRERRPDAAGCCLRGLSAHRLLTVRSYTADSNIAERTDAREHVAGAGVRVTTDQGSIGLTEATLDPHEPLAVGIASASAPRGSWPLARSPLACLQVRQLGSRRTLDGACRSAGQPSALAARTLPGSVGEQEVLDGQIDQAAAGDHDGHATQRAWMQFTPCSNRMALVAAPTQLAGAIVLVHRTPIGSSEHPLARAQRRIEPAPLSRSVGAAQHLHTSSPSAGVYTTSSDRITGHTVMASDVLPRCAVATLPAAGRRSHPVCLVRSWRSGTCGAGLYRSDRGRSIRRCWN
jgi:hypothetical protein